MLSPIFLIRDPARKFAFVWISAFGASFVLTAAVLTSEVGSRAFWHRLVHPVIDHGAYDILAATIAGSLGIFLVLYFSSVLTLVALGRSAHYPRLVIEILGSGWTFLPFLYLCFVFDLLLAAAWGFPRVWLGLIVVVVAGGPVLFSMTQMARTALTLLDEDSEVHVRN